MTNLVRLGSFVVDNSYSNEPDPWDNDIPLSFQSVRRESHAKPPQSLRIPRSITLPGMLVLRHNARNRNSGDTDQGAIPPKTLRLSPTLLRASPFTRHRIVDEHHPIEDGIPASMNKKSFIRTGHKSMPPSQPSTSSGEKRIGARKSSKMQKKKTQGGLSERDVKLKNKTEGKVGQGDMKVKETGRERNMELEDIPPMSPISEDEGNEGELASRRNRLRGRVRRVWRLRRRERA